jgi:hypothetical protein
VYCNISNTFLQSCEVVEGIFKAGVWLGILIAIIAIVMIVKLVSGKKS